MVNPARVDAIIDLAYGALIVLAIVMIATLEFGIGIAFGLGVFSAYILHVVWKMARFDPDWMTKTIEATVEETVGETVEREVSKVQEQVQAVGDRVDRRPRADEVEEIIEDSIEADPDR